MLTCTDRFVTKLCSYTLDMPNNISLYPVNVLSIFVKENPDRKKRKQEGIFQKCKKITEIVSEIERNKGIHTSFQGPNMEHIGSLTEQ